MKVKTTGVAMAAPSVKPAITPGDLVVIRGHHERQWNGMVGLVSGRAAGSHFNWVVLVQGQTQVFNEHHLWPQSATSSSHDKK